MAIPRIQPYAVPGAADLPPSVAPWRPDARRCLLLVHDMQRYFVDFLPEGRGPRTTVVANVGLLRRAARALSIPVAYSVQPGSMASHRRGLLMDLWGPGMRAEPGHRDVVPELAPAPGDVLVEKTRYSAFHGTDLSDVLRRYGRDQLVICGVYAHIGCLMTACDALARDIEPFLVADAVADFSAQWHRIALEYAAARCAVVLSTGQLLAHLGTDATAPAPASARIGPAVPAS